MPKIVEVKPLELNKNKNICYEHNIESEKMKEKIKKCYRCSGKGVIEEGISQSVLVRCPICGGKGYIKK